ncbi:hypothetical protein [Chryseobacterium balustinum]|uniref:Uncharacterized protein n=1 Tax=Chryseobacterium balustinum TaxID=246 RepID=A0AAX2IR26_9FLAO|nr:hypothetical protein [Chryseobacterium balustinum]AZB28440.1 hypothetical protein EB354_03705 [Chryseobacterium balustinum]SKC12339.1 hypothetical protein SAMN05421800_13919 [Chryseobacterium balustinum]SQA92580.1 Uncharacterised protein [Chryseobacterium balustinum]
MGSVLGGGNFWVGAGTGLIVTAFNFLAHKIDPDVKPEYNDKSLTKWVRKNFEGVKGADKIKVKTNAAPKDRVYKDDKIYGKDSYGNYTIHEWGVQDGNKLYISRYTYDQGMLWLYLVSGHELMHYSFDLLFPKVTAAYQHVTILDWQVKQLTTWGITEGWMFDQSNAPLNNLIERYPKAFENINNKGWNWEKTGMNLNSTKP